jgi:hypothetical protein
MPIQGNTSLRGVPGNREGSCRLEAGQLVAPGLSSRRGAAECTFASPSRRADRALLFGDNRPQQVQASRVGGMVATQLGRVPRMDLSLIRRPSAPRAEQSLRASKPGSGRAPQGVRARRPTASVGGGASGPRTDDRAHPGRAYRARGGCAASNDRRPSRLSRDDPGVDHFQPQRISRRVEDK